MNMRERELVKVVHTFSVDNGFVADKYAIQTAYRKHPMQNSMRCVSDVLDEIGVDHEVCSLEKCSGIDLNGKILFVPYESRPLSYVSNHCQNTLTLYDGKFKKDVSIGKIEAKLPLYVIQTFGRASDEKTHRKVAFYLRNKMWDLGDNGLWLLMLISLFALIFINLSSLQVILLRLCLLCGLAVSSLIVLKGFSAMDVGKGLCDTIGPSGCSYVIDSENSRLFGLIPLADLALTYFLVELVLSLTIHDPSSFPTFLFVSCLTLPVVAYSIGWQLKRRSYCVYCLAVDCLLVMEFLLLLTMVRLPLDADVSYILCFTFGCASTLFMITILRNNSLDRTTNKRLRRKEESILSDPDLLMNLLMSGRQIVSLNELNFPTLNNGLQEYEHWLFVAVNPYCLHCKEIVNGLKALENIRIDVVFAVYDQTGVNAASWILEKYEADETHGDMNEVLNRWYSSMELPRGWKSRAEYERMALSHSRFAGNKRITETPFVCIDGKRLPDVYDYTELKFLF